MAYHKRHRRHSRRAAKKHSSTRRHRMGAVKMKMNASSPIVQIGALAVGYLLGDTLNTGIDNTVFKSSTPSSGAMKGVAVAEAGIGAALMMMGKKTMLKTVAGGVLAGAGIKRAAKAFGIISGYGSVPVVGYRRMNGYGEVPVVGAVPGFTPSASLNGYTPNIALGASVPVRQNVMGSVGLMRSGD